MRNFHVIVNRTICVDLIVDATSKEQAERIATKQIETEYEDLHDWYDYDPKNIEFFVKENKP